jgi:hypothetical protein
LLHCAQVMCWGASAGVSAASACSGCPVDAEKVRMQLKIASKTKPRGQIYNQFASFLPWTRPLRSSSGSRSARLGSSGDLRVGNATRDHVAAGTAGAARAELLTRAQHR